MTTLTENDIKQVNEKIDKLAEIIASNHQMVETRFNDLEKNQIRLEGKIEAIDTRLDTQKPAIDKIPDLAEKVGELKNWKQIGLVVITALISSIFSGSIGGVIG